MALLPNGPRSTVLGFRFDRGFLGLIEISLSNDFSSFGHTVPKVKREGKIVNNVNHWAPEPTANSGE